MTQTTMPTPVGDLDHLIREGLSALDITQAEFDRAVQRYTGLGAVLDERWASTRGSNFVFPQGSFNLGTVVRNVSRNDDIDIDIVAVRDISKYSISQEELKDEVGDAARAYARLPGSGRPELEESSRCWTLIWPDMHMDILPAIPNVDGGGDNLLITDRDVRSWLMSNPSGYAQWFKARMSMSLLATRAAESKQLDIQDVPTWRHRTVLQRVVQALKRHRDVYFAHHLHDRPSSIVLTTLAAHAYNGGSDLYSSLRQVVTDMQDFLELRDDEWYLENPAQSEENFVDGWADDPARAGHFFSWLRAAQAEFAQFETKSGLQHVMPLFEASFGGRFATGARQGLADILGTAREESTLRMKTGGTLATASTTLPAASRPVRSHQFAGGSSI
ncbi:nucleotidyltransferase domain-containing protein [Cellulomonas sp. Y8]|uniref:nucleotidyltransferase domain-containing protein n=1 Tax=Cellulomonas sp. Y8 TaxID=2591145 RepID=UPI003D7548AF